MSKLKLLAFVDQFAPDRFKKADRSGHKLRYIRDVYGSLRFEKIIHIQHRLRGQLVYPALEFKKRIRNAPTDAIPGNTLRNSKTLHYRPN